MQPCSHPRYGLIDWSNEMSGELLREMIERDGSGCTIVASGGSSSSRLPQPSSTASERVDSKRPSGFDTAPRPVRTVGRVGEDMAPDATGYTTSLPAADCPTG